MQKNLNTSPPTNSGNDRVAIDLTPLTASLGAPLPAWGSPGVARTFGLSAERPVSPERGELQDLVWAIAEALPALTQTPANSDRQTKVVLMRFPSGAQNPPGFFWLVFILRRRPGGHRELHLSLPGEPVPALRPRVLLVEHDPRILQCLGLLLQTRGFEVLALHRGGHPMELARLMRPDLLFLDLDPLGTNGLGLCARLKAHPETSDIPVLACTGWPEMKDPALAVGALDLIEKPAGLLGLAPRLNRILGLPPGSDPQCSNQEAQTQGELEAQICFDFQILVARQLH